MVFVKFHNMNRKKKFPNVAFKLKLKKFHFTTSQNNITITVQKCSVFFSSFFNLCTDVLSILQKCLFFLSFFFSYMLCSTMFKFLLFFFLCLFFFYCPVRFCFCFHFVFTFFLSFFFHNKLLIQCPILFFFNLISTSLSLP